MLKSFSLTKLVFLRFFKSIKPIHILEEVLKCASFKESVFGVFVSSWIWVFFSSSSRVVLFSLMLFSMLMFLSFSCNEMFWLGKTLSV